MWLSTLHSASGKNTVNNTKMCVQTQTLAHPCAQNTYKMYLWVALTCCVGLYLVSFQYGIDLIIWGLASFGSSLKFVVYLRIYSWHCLMQMVYRVDHQLCSQCSVLLLTCYLGNTTVMSNILTCCLKSLSNYATDYITDTQNKLNPIYIWDIMHIYACRS